MQFYRLNQRTCLICDILVTNIIIYFSLFCFGKSDVDVICCWQRKLCLYKLMNVLHTCVCLVCRLLGWGGLELVVERSGFPLMAGDGIDCEIGRDEPKYM